MTTARFTTIPLGSDGTRHHRTRTATAPRPDLVLIGAALRPTEKLAGGARAVDVAPQPFHGGLGGGGLVRVAVGDPQPAALAALERLGDVGAEVVDHVPDAAHREVVDAFADVAVDA
jgi:hypothetical protein